RLLSLLGVRHIVTDKVFDVWLDNIFYDLQFPATLSPGATSHIWTEDIPDFPAPAIGVVYHTPPQSRGKAAQLVVRYASGLEKRFDIRAGDGRPWDNKEFGRDYNLVFTGLPAASDGPITAVGVIASRPIVVRGVSLIQPAGPTSRSLILTTEGNYRAIHGGDVKIYENLDVMPRAFVVHQTQVVSGVRQAVAELKSPRFDPAAAIVRPVRSGESPGLLTLGRPGSPASVTIVAYLPERVELLAELTSPGWLVFTDTDYPGWRATIDGADTEILEADIMFRAVELPAGPHRIIFEYRPIPFYGGIIVSLLGLGLIAGGLAAGGGKKPSNKTGKQVDATLDNTYNQG
ncbi:MAG: YfhO family protein, partial [Anaerolineae bacterium]